MAHKEIEKRAIFEKVKSHEIPIEKAYELIKEIIEDYGGVQSNVDQLVFYQSEWVQKDPNLVRLEELSIEPLIIFDFHSGLSDKLFDIGVISRSNTAIVYPGQSYMENEKNNFIINPENAGDYIAVLNALLQQGMLPKSILNFWPIYNKQDIKLENNEAFLKLGIFATFQTLKAISDLKVKSILKYMVALNSQNNITNPFFEAINGFAGSLNISMPKLIFSTFEAAFDDADLQGTLEALIHELANYKHHVPYAIKLEQNKRYVRNIIKADFSINSKKVMLRNQGIYLITGGTGGLGLIFARYLATNYQAKLVLTGRSPLNNIKETAIEEMRKSGAEVIYLQADVGNLQDMKNVLHTTLDKFEALNGVFHISGLNSISNMFKKDVDEFKNILWSKIQGTVVLDTVTKELDMDFILLFSSIASVLGDFGQGDYALGNSFIDSFVNYREALRKEGKRKGMTKCINWPLWREGGMHLEKETETLYLQSSGMSYLENKEGIKIVEGILSSNQDHLIPVKGSKEHIERVINQHNIGKEIASVYYNEISKNKTTISTAPGHLTLEQKIAYDITKIASDILKIDIGKLDENENIGSYGFDSISLKEFADKLSELFRVEITPVIFFDLSTLKDIRRFLLSGFNKEMSELYESQPLIEAQSIIPSQKAVKKTLNVKYKLDGAEKEPIAIIGMSGIFPGSDDMDAYWENLISEKDLITEIPLSRWDWKTYESQFKDQYEKFSKWGGFINNIDVFDAKFFNISPKEAEYMDPQQKIFLETVWKTIEDAGYQASSLSGRDIGVFVGVQPNEYNELVNATGTILPQQVTGNANTLIPNRISYLYNFRGPSEAIDTACSSSFVALNRAVKSIRCGECEMALAGGISLMISPNVFIGAIKLGVLSTDGRCKTFDKSANGYVRGEGVGCVLLKPLSKAITDNDHIHAIIKGIAEGHGGKANSLTAPNSDAQASLLMKAYKDAGISPETITYLEAHGTGTELGDPVEIQGIKKAFNTMVNEKDFRFKFCGIGSVKTNIGHLEPASGIASLLKVILCMKYKMLPSNLHFKELNPYIELEKTPFYILDQTKSWERLIDDNGAFIPRRAGISSFGFGGAGVHALIEEYDANNEVIEVDIFETHVIILSAKQKDQLKHYAEKLLQYLCKNLEVKETQLYEIAYTLQTGRESMNYRLAIKTNSIEALINDLRCYVEGKLSENIMEGFVKDNAISSLLSSGNGQMFIKNTLAEHDIERLIQLWINGVEIDWGVLYNTIPRKVSLPTYPFAKDRYWIINDSDTHKQLPIKSPVNSLYKEENEVVYTTYSWEKKDLMNRCVHKMNVRLLLFESSNNLKDILNSQYDLDRFDVIHVVLGNEYEVVSQKEYKLNPLCKEDFNQLLGQLSKDELIPTHIIWYESSLMENNDSINNAKSLVQGLVNLCSSLFKGDFGKHISKLVFAYNINELHVIPEWEGISSLLKTACLENKKLDYKVISFNVNDQNSTDIVNMFMNELDDDDKEVMYCKNARYIKQIDFINPSIMMTKSQESLIIAGGIYIITGGLGGLGFIFADYLVKKYNVQLVLTGRSELNFEKQEKLSELKKYSEKVTYKQSDISDREAVKRLIDDIKREFGEINGIIHSAGVIRDSYILNKTNNEISEVLLPKVGGIYWLDEMTKGEKLDFFVCFSSIAAVLGNPGQADYAFANSYMDAFIKKRMDRVNLHQRFGKSISINWPLWREGGMQVSDQVERMLGERFGLRLMASQIGTEAFESILKNNNPQVSVFYGNKQRLNNLLNIKSKDQSVNQSIIQTFKDDCIKLACEILNMNTEDMDLEEEMSAFGYDSLSFTEFSNRLKDQFDFDVMPAIFYEYRTMQLFIEYLMDEYEEQLQKYYSNTVDFKIAKTNDKNSPTICDRVESTVKIEPIAIVGIGGIMPGADHLQTFWENIEAGKDSVTEVPCERWDWKEIYGNPGKEPNKTNIKWGGFINNVDKFDPAFFGLSMEEAKLMDPQQRIMLETVWKTIEDAGYKSKDLSDSKTGVFIGVGVMDYGDVLNKKGVEIHAGISTGMSHSIVANRISYLLNLRGPSEPIDTACASALYAVHRAAEEIQLGHCDAAIVGAIKLTLSPTLYIAFNKAGMLSEDGRCKTFDQTANGYVRGEGAGAIFLKPLSKAISDGDHIYALIKGSAVNHGGHGNTLTTPNPNAQADVIVSAWKRAGVNPCTIGYIEAHGAGTPIGDVIEVNAMKKAFKQLYKEWGINIPDIAHCGIGSVKTNIGHLETAAGMAGLLKVILSIKNKKIPPSIHLKNINSNIQLKGSPLYIVDETKSWDIQPGEVRRAGVSAFGYGGVNAHIALEEYKPNTYDSKTHPIENIKAEQNPTKSQIIILSAKDQERLLEYAKSMVDYLEGLSLTTNRMKVEDICLENIAYTLQVGRDEMSERLAIVTSDIVDLHEKLISFVKGKDDIKGLYYQSKNENSSYKMRKEDEICGDLDYINLEKIAEQWISGKQINWEKLYCNCKVGRLSLPTYPFAKESCWITSKEKE